jgi:hypothetical protein
MHVREEQLASALAPARYQGMCRRLLLLLLAAGAMATGWSAPVGAAAPALTTDPLHLPDFKVTGGPALKDFTFPAKGFVTAPSFPANDPFISVQFPGRAVFEGVATGRATVGVMLDQAGQPADFLLIRYTRPYFGQALLEEARRQKFTPKKLGEIAVPGTFTFSYHFEPPGGLTSISSFEASGRRAEEVLGPGLGISRTRKPSSTAASWNRSG